MYVLLSADPDWVRDRIRSPRGTSLAHHDDEASSNGKYRPLEGPDVLGTRYCYQPVCVNPSDLCAVRTVGINLSTRMRIVWRRGRASINRLLGNAPTAHRPVFRLPYEIVEIIIAHIAHDLDALKACSLACHSWYSAAFPHLHRTLTLTDRGKLEPLSELHRLGWMPLVREIRVVQWRDEWFALQALSPHDLCHFSAFANVQALVLDCLDISLFTPGIEPYFAHLAPTLQSIAFLQPRCTPPQLSHLLSLFPNLDDIKICWPRHPRNTTISDTDLVPFSTPRLRGRLVVYDFDSVETWTRLITAGGGLRFRYIHLWKAGGCVPVLFEACADTLETLRFYATDPSFGE